jgi:hypothetical protein
MVFAIYFGEILNRKTFMLGSLAVLLTEVRILFFVNTRKYRWSKEMLALDKKLLSSWRVK